MRRTVNYKAVLILLVGLAVLSGAVHLVHGFQVRRNARSLLNEARQAENEGRARQAGEAFAQYLRLQPDDADARARFGLLLSQQARTPDTALRALLVLEQALRQDPGRDDVRRHVAELSLKLHRYGPARKDLTELLKPYDKNKDPNAVKGHEEKVAELTRLLAQCELGEHHSTKALNLYDEASRLAPHNIDIFMEHAGVALHEQGPAGGDLVVRKMRQHNPDSAPAHLAAGLYYFQQRNLKRAGEEVEILLNRLKQRDVKALLLATSVATALGQYDKGRSYLDEALKQDPKDFKLLLARARLESQAGDNKKALEVLKPLLAEPPSTPEGLWGLAAVLADLGEADRAEAVLKSLRGTAAAGIAGYLQARLLIKESQWGNAVHVLTDLRGQGLRPDMDRQVNLLLARCYQRLANPDQQVAACRRVLDSDPTSEPARALLADGLASMGRTAEALAEYRQLGGPGAQLQEARLLLAQTLRQPATDRNWDRVQKALAELPPEKADDPAVVLLQAQLSVAKGEADEVKKRMTKECALHPERVTAWLLLVDLALWQGRHAEVLPLLDRAEKAVGRRVAWDLARARYWAGAEKAEAHRHLAELEAGLGSRPAAEQDLLRSVLAACYAAAEDLPSAERLWKELARQHPEDLNYQFVLFEVALGANRTDDAGRILAEIQRLEPQDGGLAPYCRAALQVHAAAHARGPERDRLVAGLTEATELLKLAERARPSWSRVTLLEAQIADLENKPEQALEKYQAAVDLGEGRLSVARRIVQLLQQQGRYAEVSPFLRRLPERALVGHDLGRLAAQLSLVDAARPEVQDPKKARKDALDLARRVANDSKDYRDHLWLAQMMALAGDPKEAEAEYRKACELDPKAPEAWASLLLFLAAHEPAKVEAERTNATRQLTEDQMIRILGAVYEAMGKPQEARRQYRILLAAHRDDPQVLRTVAAFHDRNGDKADAQELLRQLMDPRTKAPSEMAAWARRALALSLAFGGNYEDFQKAQLLLAPNGASKETASDRQVRLLVLATQPSHRGEAIELFERLSGEHAALAPDVQFILAQLYEAAGKWEKARAVLLGLLAEQPRNRVFLDHTARRMLQHGEADQAEPLVARLEKVLPDAFSPAELRARLLHARGKDDAAEDVVQAYAKKKGARLELAAGVLAEFGRTKAAETLFRRLADTGRPASSLPLAVFFARQHRTAEALNLCEKALTTSCPPEAVGLAAITVLRAGKADAAQHEKVERWLSAALDEARKKKERRALTLYRLLAELRDVQGHYKEAATLYQDILHQEPENVIALNNLAYLTALNDKDDRVALELIDAALKKAGPQAELLDTRAVVYLHAGKAELALGDLKAAVAQAPTADKLVHLAEAELRCGDAEAASRTYQQAVAQGLKPDTVHPLERSEFESLSRGLKKE